MRTFVRATTPPAAVTLEQAWYVDPAVYRRESERIFARSWLAVGRSDAIASAGDFFLVEIAGESLIVVRDGSNSIHACYNVCRHRGTRLCTDHAGTFKGSLQCPYHAWTYGLDGTLLVARNMEGVTDFDRADYPLREAHVAELYGFIFVALDPPEPFEVAFAPLLRRFDAWTINRLESRSRIEYDVACNWKFVFQNYSECYHCPVIHPQLEKLSHSDSGRNDLSDGPFLGGYSELRDAAASLNTTGARTRDPLPSLPSEELGRVYYYTIFPSLLLSLHPDYVMAHYVTPVAADRTRIVCEWLFEPGVSAVDDAVEFWDVTNRQDWRVSELTQLGVASRAYTPGPYAQSEGLLHAFDRHYRSVMA
ncbi:MAG: aromatic ring-hydroxylating dioxygenase subunit alpha [Candidatus Eremiobacteraeota bacterium]|nr:aromatic ring-hydroxylating dioxygenase subunit alpha [Candidatus Eremiobacteraeota bacterium]